MCYLNYVHYPAPNKGKKLGATLFLVTSIAAASLAAVYSVTKPLIAEQKARALENALTIALPGIPRNAIVGNKSEENPDFYIGYADDEKSTIYGYAFVAYGPAYSSTIETMVGVDTLGYVLGLQVLDQKETPGLGTKIEEIKYGESYPWFLQQFLEPTPKRALDLAVDKDGGDIASITGATISSRALTNSIVKGYQKINNALPE